MPFKANNLRRVIMNAEDPRTFLYHHLNWWIDLLKDNQTRFKQKCSPSSSEEEDLRCQSRSIIAVIIVIIVQQTKHYYRRDSMKCEVHWLLLLPQLQFCRRFDVWVLWDFLSVLFESSLRRIRRIRPLIETTASTHQREKHRNSREQLTSIMSNTQTFCRCDVVTLSLSSLSSDCRFW